MSDTDDFGRKFFVCDHLNESSEDVQAEERRECTRDEANLISSDCGQGVHMPALDFDIPARLIPSTTPGHFHLYIDKPMAWDDYEKVLIALRDAHVLEAGFVKNSIARKATFVRPPWIKKPAKAPAP
jgi:hypothetical protein